MLTLSHLTREFVRVDLLTSQDLSGATVEFALKAPDEDPDELDWSAGTIAPKGEAYEARILVGDGGDIPLTSPTYPYDWQIWLRLTDNPERPVRRPGIVTAE